MNITKGLYKALESKYFADIEDAKVRMSIYFEKSVCLTILENFIVLKQNF